MMRMESNTLNTKPYPTIDIYEQDNNLKVFVHFSIRNLILSIDLLLKTIMNISYEFSL